MRSAGSCTERVIAPDCTEKHRRSNSIRRGGVHVSKYAQIVHPIAIVVKWPHSFMVPRANVFGCLLQVSKFKVLNR